MMLGSLYVLVVALLVSAYAHVIPDGQKADKFLPDLSLPEVFKLDSIPNTFTVQGSAALDGGRIVLTPKSGSSGALWAKKPLESYGSFTLEWTVRSFNYRGFSDGGLALWLVAQDPATSTNDKKLYAGPSKFAGLQLLMDNSGPYGEALRAQLSDGTAALGKAGKDMKSFGSCLLGYQDSSVPATIRVSYDMQDNHLLKVQVNNKVCFQTRKVKLIDPAVVSGNQAAQFYIGASADNGAQNPESFEVLKLQVYDRATEQSRIPNAKAMSQPRVVTQMTDSKTGKTKLIDKAKFDAERNDAVSNYDLFQKLDKVEGRILVNDVAPLHKEMDAVIKTQEGVLAFLEHFLTTMNDGDSGSAESPIAKDKEEFKEFISMNEKLASLLEEQEHIREISKNHNTVQGDHDSHVDEIVGTLKFWLVPIGVVLMFMTYYTFRTQQYITKTKYL